MPLEFEYQFFNYNKTTIIKNIKKLGFKKKGIFIFKVMVFTHPLNTPNTYIRIRDEGHRITLTYKSQNPKSKFENEDEVLIDHFENGVTILQNLGCKKKYYYEKIREIWSFGNSEIVFDTNPGEPERMEIESHTKKELDSLTKTLNLSEFIVGSEYDPLKELFGFELESDMDLTFLTAKKVLGKLVKKDKKFFKELVDEQIELYNKIK
jgi:adenylate cyclase class 2